MLPLQNDAINTIRTLSIDAIERAQSGHPGAPMGLAAAAYTLWHYHLKHNPNNPDWVNRDRFILSNGHASMLLYSLLHLTGYPDITIEQLKNFRQWDSLTPGHPERQITRGVETTTGPLGQGISTAVGFAIAEAHLHDTYDGIIDHFTFGICSDGDLMEGISGEASSLAGHLKLGKLIFLYDDNKITIDGTTSIAFTEDVAKRYQAYGWQTIHVEDGNDVSAIHAAINEAKATTDKPSLIILRTHIGFGSPNKQDSPSSHGSPLGANETSLTKAAYAWEHPPFFVAEEVAQHMNAAKEGEEAERTWQQHFDAWCVEHPEQAKELTFRLKGDGLDDLSFIPSFPVDPKGTATRSSGGKVLHAVLQNRPELIGGSADLAASNKTFYPDRGVISPESKTGQMIHFGIREHAMAAITNGLTLHGGCRGFHATFLVFLDYMKPALRLAALSKIPTLSIFTHDSIGLGEDGPTHQPIEQIAQLRATPNFFAFRPADANETALCWKAALGRLDGPSALILTRQDLPTLDLTHSIGSASEGAYVVLECDNPAGVLIATGSELHPCLEAASALAAEGTPVRVVSMPCWELFEQQPESYRNTILPPSLKKRLAVEAACTFGWHRYVGSEGDVLGLDHFGESAPAEVLFEKFGFTATNIAARFRALL